MEFSTDVKEIISVLAADPNVMEIWLIGSRVSGNINQDSDWDILVFSKKEPIERTARVEGIDVLWKAPSGDILLEGQQAALKIKFSDFNWVLESQCKATYMGRKFNAVGDGIRDTSIPAQSIQQCEAIKLWPTIEMQHNK